MQGSATVVLYSHLDINQKMSKEIFLYFVFQILLRNSVLNVYAHTSFMNDKQSFQYPSI